VRWLSLVNIWSTDYHTIGFFEAFSSAYQAFGLPSTIRTCDLRLRSCKNELKQLVKQWDRGAGFWCGISTEICGVGWNWVDIAWYSEAVGWSAMEFVGLTDKTQY